MQRLRTTFKRSRTPTGAEMKTQSSLEVPKQVRSASFDEIQLEAKRLQANQGEASGPHLRVPHSPAQQRSRSVDSGGSEESSNFLEVPKRFQRRRSSGAKTIYCVHCVCLEEYNRIHASFEPPLEMLDRVSSLSISDTSSSEFEEEFMLPECAIKVYCDIHLCEHDVSFVEAC